VLCFTDNDKLSGTSGSTSLHESPKHIQRTVSDEPIASVAPVEQSHDVLQQQNSAVSSASDPSEAAKLTSSSSSNDLHKSQAELEMDLDYVPHFQRVYISGDDNSGVS
jgi:hypothetical protein